MSGTDPKPTPSAAMTDYLHLERRLLAGRAAGSDKVDEAEVLAEMDALWGRMTDAERAALDTHPTTVAASVGGCRPDPHADAAVARAVAREQERWRDATPAPDAWTWAAGEWRRARRGYVATASDTEAVVRDPGGAVVAHARCRPRPDGKATLPAMREAADDALARLVPNLLDEAKPT